MKRQRGEILLATLVVIGAVATGVNYAINKLFPPTDIPGTFTFIPSGFAILKMDTRTGEVQRCFLVGKVLTCEPTKPAKKERKK